MWVEVDGKRLTCEVKTERKHAQTRNICLEYWNPRSNKPSGVSASQSHLWVTVLADSIWCVRTEELKRFVSALAPGDGVRRLERIGDGNSNAFIVPDRLLLGPVYFRLDSELDPLALIRY